MVPVVNFTANTDRFETSYGAEPAPIMGYNPETPTPLNLGIHRFNIRNTHTGHGSEGSGMENMRNRTNLIGRYQSAHLLRYVIILCTTFLIASAVTVHDLALNRQCCDDGAMALPRAVALDHSGRVYIADPVDNVIRCYSKDGNLISQWGSAGKDDGQFDFPSGIAVSPDGLIYVADMYNRRIQEFRYDGTFVAKWRICQTQSGKFSLPYGIAADSEGLVYVVDALNHRIQRFGPNGDFLNSLPEQGASECKLRRPAHTECWQNLWNTCD